MDKIEEGIFPLPRQCSSIESPSLMVPFGDSTHTLTAVEGSLLRENRPLDSVVMLGNTFTTGEKKKKKGMEGLKEGKRPRGT
ncbi:hypothetical protein EYF80_014350 [Liparis tanakae]|uniref:Uncharacterized protein n=1 Tax=Liparis tanakae TaxID=230148 RepID=A0A4Z2IC07_9TELE|nr:hypothetical protein EYF80_014350 [Liparis tanakae]